MARVVEISEYLRAKMVSVAVLRECLTHPDVIELSQRLDRYLLQTQRVLTNPKLTGPEGSLDAVSSTWAPRSNVTGRVGVSQFPAQKTTHSTHISAFYPRHN
jgi:Spo0E like sporulation regulatory protein